MATNFEPNPYAGLGEPRQDCGGPCSLCGAQIIEGEDTLTLRADGLMWLYCADCEAIVRKAYKEISES